MCRAFAVADSRRPVFCHLYRGIFKLSNVHRTYIRFVCGSSVMLFENTTPTLDRSSLLPDADRAAELASGIPFPSRRTWQMVGRTSPFGANRAKCPSCPVRGNLGVPASYKHRMQPACPLFFLPPAHAQNHAGTAWWYTHRKHRAAQVKDHHRSVNYRSQLGRGRDKDRHEGERDRLAGRQTERS